ncbi:hypothetical protein AB0942_03555 [Streptomyces nodosus]|uniref:hypothetical protein n=1 Tax=Streptomyces nodosus TaxID=40318 RepID=UPI003452CB1D
MPCKRHGAMGAALALLVLLSALFCARSSAPPLFEATHSPTASEPRLAPCHTALDDSGHGEPVGTAKAPCLKKVQPERQHPRFGALPAPAASAEAADQASARGSAYRDARHHGPEPSPPDLTELSVQRV